MYTKELIAMATIRSGKKRYQMAEEMGHAGETRLSKIAAGTLAPNSSELAYLARQAGVEPLDAISRYESEKHPALSWIWNLAAEPVKAGFASLK